MMILKNKAENPTHGIFGVAPDGSVISAPISTFPHALITGTTGAGKSVFINFLLLSVMLVADPREVKFIIIDPKGNEFGNYKGLPYMLTNPIIDLRDSATALEYLASEMDYRLQLFQKHGGKKDIEAFNKAIDKGKIKGVEKLPYIILMIDELADLMSQHKSEVEGSIKRLGAKARASGVHMLLATQTPRKEYVDGAIKANVGTKFALMASNPTESLVTLGETGAEKLRKHGDFLCSIAGGQLQRGQGLFVEEEEILETFDYLKENYPPPELVEINSALDDAKLRYQKVLAENKGENPDDVTMDDIKAEETSSVIMPQAKQSSRSDEERRKAKEQHDKTMAKIEENKKNGDKGSKTVSIDTSKFSFAERNKRRKEKGLEEKPKSSVVPASSSKSKRKQETTQIEQGTAQSEQDQKVSRPKNDESMKVNDEPKTEKKVSHIKDSSNHTERKTKRRPTNGKGSVSERTKRKTRPTSSGGSPLARKR